eukprot:TRINITY_DN15165_c1_g1_i1.p1 TRINITY_DN15165_c1_g1~~TRINITY_DN15165_c1_g1_i1.p1  ORF type:complete len:623 (+),score=154.57 TRINITY_DN15165_c1_g1_i1:55-1923(+)
MGNTSSSAPVRGVPMSPTAWALASLWSEIWDAPRFRGSDRVHKPLLSREALAPLLKISASCVVALQPHVRLAEVKAVPPQGASRELLVAAVDGDPLGAALADPCGDPAGFVRALVKAAFMTGDGDFIEGLTEESVEKLMEEHCQSQLEQAALLVRDPSAALLKALEAARSAVQDIVSTPPQEGDLAGVASRLLLIQRLERVVQDATSIIESKQEESSIEASTDKRNSSDEQVAQGSSRHDEKAAEENPADADEEEQPPLKRTKSQVAATLKVQKVKQHHEDMLKEVHDLSRTTSTLAKHDVANNEVEKIRQELRAVEEARKKARNFGEDLLEDMLLLDNISGLAEEDRSMRKATISGLEGLLQDVDAAKARLANLHRQLEDNLKKAEEAQGAHAQARAEEPAPVQGRQEAPKKALHPEARQARQGALEPPPPGMDVWQKLRLPLRFHSREEASQYVISATVPGLDLEHVKLELGDSDATLHISGLRVPSAQEATTMRRKIAQKIYHVAQRSPEQYAKLAKSMPQVAADAYVELGQGEFGRFGETFRLPEDVDVERIDASYRDGVLRVMLPKIMLRQRQLPQGYPDGRFMGRGPASRDVGLGPGGAAPWGGRLFGGHDDYFRW